MLKMFQASVHRGDEGEFWDDVWRDADVAAARSRALDPLRPLMDAVATADPDVVLEGGCGHGGWVAYLAERRTPVVGLDFGLSTLAHVRAVDPALVLAAGDVAALPLRSGSVGAYYSGGVVEHFEDGPVRALAEAHRVLRPGGQFLVSVPYLSPLRRALAPLYRREWQRVPHPAVDATADGLQFFQYVFGRREFARQLADQGFEVEVCQPYSVVWGLFESPFVRSVYEALARRSRPSSPAPPCAETSNAGICGEPTRDTNGASPSLVRRLVVAEDRSVPVLGLGVRAVGWCAANMMMYVCRRR